MECTEVVQSHVRQCEAFVAHWEKLSGHLFPPASRGQAPSSSGCSLHISSPESLLPHFHWQASGASWLFYVKIPCSHTAPVSSSNSKVPQKYSEILEPLIFSSLAHLMYMILWSYGDYGAICFKEQLGKGITPWQLRQATSEEHALLRCKVIWIAVLGTRTKSPQQRRPYCLLYLHSPMIQSSLTAAQPWGVG